MVEHKNFYENVKEAEMRLLHTAVMYDGEPYYVLCITDHKGDGIFRMYLDRLGNPKGPYNVRFNTIPYEWHQESPTGLTRGQKMDQWMEDNPDSGLIRKQMDSPKFNKFRPFPLGMCNIGGTSMYIERVPTRHTQQGLTQSMITTEVARFPGEQVRVPNINFSGSEFYDTIKGNYPSAKECLTNLRDPDVTNRSVAFHRLFAFLRGPCDLTFLVYKDELIGYVPPNMTDTITLKRDKKHLKEVVELTGVFKFITTA